MTKYFFNCEVNGSLAMDDEGLELLSLDAVEDESTRSAMNIACDEFSPTGGNGVVVVEARDENGQIVLTVRCTTTTTAERSANRALDVPKPCSG